MYSKFIVFLGCCYKHDDNEDHVFANGFHKNPDNEALYSDVRLKVSEIMNRYAGIVRSEDTLNEGLAKINELADELDGLSEDSKEYYIEAAKRLITVARLIIVPALMRKESRGGHYREDYPCSDESYAVHSVQRIGQSVVTAPVNGGYFKF